MRSQQFWLSPGFPTAAETSWGGRPNVYCGAALQRGICRAYGHVCRGSMAVRSRYACQLTPAARPFFSSFLHWPGQFGALARRFAPLPCPAYTHIALRAHMFSLQAARHELRPTIRLAWPLVLAEIGWMSMGIVDTVMVGHLPDSARAIGSVSISSNLFNVLAFFGGGLLVGLDTLVAQAFGAGRREDCHRSLVNSIYLSMVMTPFLMTPVWFFNPLLRRLDIEPQVAALAVPYMKALAFGLFPLLLYFAVRRCLQAMNMAQPIAFALVSANIVNALFNWVLIYGKWGARAMGVGGSGGPPAIPRRFWAPLFASYLLWSARRNRTKLLKTRVATDFFA